MATEAKAHAKIDARESRSSEARPRFGPPRDLRIKIFADGANLETIQQLATDPTIHGFTTNPSLLRQNDVRDYREFAARALEAVGDKPISFEVLADTADEVRRQARVVAGWGHNVYVKVPVTNSDGQSLTDAVHDLARDGVKINVTAVFTLEQIMQACSAVYGGAPAIISVFAGRIADAGYDPVPRMVAALRICRAVDPCIELLWASPREVLNVVQANEVGVDVITIDESIRRKLHLLGKDLLQFSKETVQMFKRDAENAGYCL
ncbi:MAG TPA: transaldolase [Gemmataceae bacterium]|nr:transaldolase [Gemmataceae bacterium]